MIEPIVVEFDVDCSPEHAFQMWVERTALWWPRSHAVTNDSDLEVVFEPRAGGGFMNVGLTVPSTSGGKFASGTHRTGSSTSGISCSTAAREPTSP